MIVGTDNNLNVVAGLTECWLDVGDNMEKNESKSNRDNTLCNTMICQMLSGDNQEDKCVVYTMVLWDRSSNPGPPCKTWRLGKTIPTTIVATGLYSNMSLYSPTICTDMNDCITNMCNYWSQPYMAATILTGSCGI